MCNERYSFPIQADRSCEESGGSHEDVNDRALPRHGGALTTREQIAIPYHIRVPDNFTVRKSDSTTSGLVSAVIVFEFPCQFCFVVLKETWLPLVMSRYFGDPINLALTGSDVLIGVPNQY